MIILVIFGLAGISFYIIARAQSISNCSVAPVPADTFTKTFHLRDNTDGFNVFPTKNGGYLLAGDTIWSTGMAIPNPFIIKTDIKGNALWSRQFSSQSLPPRDSSTSHEPHISIETADGGIITASDILDFVDAKYENVLEVYGDILVTKINSKGAQLWSIMLGDYSVDRPQKMWALPDGSVLLLARLAQTGYGNDVADISAVPKYSVLIKINKDGKVMFAKKMNWEAVDMERLADGGFIALANIAVPKTEQPEHILGPEVTTGDLPTIIKLNGSLNTEWAKSLEMIPSEINAPTSYASSSFTMGKTIIRTMGGDFKAVQPTPDGGFLAVGFDNLLLTRGLSSGLSSPVTSFTPRPFIAVKLGAAGNYQWAKKITVNLVSSITGNDFQMVKTADGKFVIMQDIIRDSAGLKAKSRDAAQKQKAMLDKCKELNSDCLDPANIIPGAKPLADAANAANKVLADALAANIELIKIDADANPMWIKKINAERNLSGYHIAPTADKGVIVSGSMLTTKMHRVMLSMEPYKEAILIKVDINGGVSGCAGVTDYRQATVEDQSRYLVTQNMNAGKITDMVLKINKKVKEKVFTIKNTARNICQYKKSVIKPLCSYLSSAPAAFSSSSQSVIPPVAKTWALINFENAKEAKIESTKNQQIHDELLPILNQLFNNQVKMTDSMNGMWLTYYFPRLVTRADVEAVQKYYEGLGYKIDESEGGRLSVSKIGLSLRMTFSIQNSMAGKLEVLF